VWDKRKIGEFIKERVAPPRVSEQRKRAGKIKRILKEKERLAKLLLFLLHVLCNCTITQGIIMMHAQSLH